MNVQNIHNGMLSDRISFWFSGYMSEDILLGIGNTLKNKYEIVREAKLGFDFSFESAGHDRDFFTIAAYL